MSWGYIGLVCSVGASSEFHWAFTVVRRYKVYIERSNRVPQRWIHNDESEEVLLLLMEEIAGHARDDELRLEPVWVDKAHADAAACTQSRQRAHINLLHFFLPTQYQGA